jgi:hypothetical protein
MIWILTHHKFKMVSDRFRVGFTMRPNATGFRETLAARIADNIIVGAESIATKKGHGIFCGNKI